MENILNKTEEILSKIQKINNEWNNILPEYKKLVQYYESPQWLQDHEDSNNGTIPPEIPQGILAEDTIFNLLSEQKETAISIMKTAINILES